MLYCKPRSFAIEAHKKNLVETARMLIVLVVFLTLLVSLASLAAQLLWHDGLPYDEEHVRGLASVVRLVILALVEQLDVLSSLGAGVLAGIFGGGAIGSVLRILRASVGALAFASRESEFKGWSRVSDMSCVLLIGVAVGAASSYLMAKELDNNTYVASCAVGGLAAIQLSLALVFPTTLTPKSVLILGPVYLVAILIVATVLSVAQVPVVGVVAAIISMHIAFSVACGIVLEIRQYQSAHYAISLAAGTAANVAQASLLLVSGNSGWAAFAFLYGIFLFPLIVGFLVSRYYNVWLLWIIESCRRICRKPRLPYRLHPVAWDEMCVFHFTDLHLYLLDLALEDRDRAERELEKLSKTSPALAFEATWAKIILAGVASREVDCLSELSGHFENLPDECDEDIHTMKQMIEEIASLQAEFNLLASPIGRGPTASLIREKIISLSRWIEIHIGAGKWELVDAGREWLKLAERQERNAYESLSHYGAILAFHAGSAVDRNQEAFVAREAIVTDLRKLVCKGFGSSGVVLYGRRRVGKSTVLRNAARFLPSSVLIVHVSMQDPNFFTSIHRFIRTLITRIDEAVHYLEGELPSECSLIDFLKYLDGANRALKKGGRNLLVALDEYENIDRKIGEGVFPEDLLATIRESTQEHRNLTWLFSGSHDISELRHAAWTSYLVSLVTVKVPPFTQEEVVTLLTEPLKHSDYWPESDPKRPVINPGFWGKGGIDRIYSETGGWPHLVQLLAESMVHVLNERDLKEAKSDLYDVACERAVETGEIVLRELIDGECSVVGEREYLRGFLLQDMQAPSQNSEVRHNILRRELILERDGMWMLRVPLMKRWMKKHW